MPRTFLESRPIDPAARGASGFTLLEVMIALAILSVSLVALAGINSGAMNMHAYSKRLTVATMLARGKMADLEQKLQSEGLPTDDDVEQGTFEEEGYEEFRWEAQIIRPKTEDIDVNSLMAMTGMGLSGGEAGGGSDPLAALGPLADQFIGEKAPEGLAGMLGGAGGDLAGMAGGAGGLLGGAMQSQMQQMLDNLGKSMREVRLTVSWGEKDSLDQFTVTTHVVSLGAGTDQAQSDVVAQQASKALQDATQGNLGAPVMPGAFGPGGPRGPLGTGGVLPNGTRGQNPLGKLPFGTGALNRQVGPKMGPFGGKR